VGGTANVCVWAGEKTPLIVAARAAAAASVAAAVAAAFATAVQRGSGGREFAGGEGGPAGGSGGDVGEAANVCVWAG